jgi:hypothetical protein
MPPRPRRRPPAKPSAKPAAKRTVAATDLFSDLCEDSGVHGKFLMFYSEAGEGKTTLAGQFPAPLFITTAGEQGASIYKQTGKLQAGTPVIKLDALFAHSEIPSESGHPGWIKCMETLRRFLTGKHNYKTVVIDSTSGLQDLCFQHGASMLYEGKMDTKSAECYWSGVFLPLCLQIVAAGYNVILIAHSTLRDVTNPTGPDFEQYRPALMKTVWEYTKKDLHGIFYLGREVNVQIDAKTKKKKTMGDRRFIGFQPSTYYIAKSWVTDSETEELDAGSNERETYKSLAKLLGI